MARLRSGPVTIVELTEGLCWPRLLRAFPLSVRPSRVLAGFGVALAATLAGWAVDWLNGRPIALGDEVRVGLWEYARAALVEGWTGLSLGLLTLDARGVWEAARLLAWDGPATMLGADPMGGAALLALLAIIVGIGGGAIARVTALDFGAGVDASMGAGLRVSLRRWRSTALGLLGPGLLALVVAALLSGLGAALLGIPGVRVAGAVLYPVLLAMGLLLAFIAFATALGLALIVPAVMADGSDALDAVQRAYAYAVGRTGRLLLYGLLLLAVGAAAWLILSSAFVAAINWTAELSSAWAGERLGGGLSGPRALFERAGEAEGTSAAIVRAWERAALLLLGGWAVSYFFTASTALYLMMRKVADGQAIEDVWVEGREGA